MKLILILAAVTLATGSPLRLVGRDFREVSCSICQHLTQDIHDVLSNQDTQNAMVSGLKDRCGSLVHEQTEVCHEMVDNMAPNMVHFISNKIHPYIMCSSMEMCPEEHIEHPAVEHIQEPVQEHVQEPEEEPEEPQVDMCEFCQFVINIVERYAQANGSIAKLNETMMNFCNGLPDPFKSDCLKFEPEVIQALSEGVPPHQACVKAHVCPSSSLEHPQIWKQVTCDLCNRVSEPLFAEDAGAVCMDMRICLRPTKPTTEVHEPEVEKKEGAGPGCELCQFIVNTVDTYLKDNHTEAAINATVTKLCNSLPEPLKDTCNGIAPELIHILAQGFDPKDACTKIGLCETTKVHEPVAEIPKASPACDMCEFLVNMIDEYLKNSSSPAAVNATVTKFCNGLPEPLKDTCLSFAPQLVAMLSGGVDPKTACSKLGLCESETTKVHEPVAEIPKAGPACELCEFLVNMIDEYLKNSSSPAAVNATVNRFCNGLPEPLKDTCLSFAPQLVAMLSGGVDPKTACSKLGLCESETTKVHEPVAEIPKASPACDMCEFLVNMIDEYLKNSSSPAAVNATVTKFCNGLPEPLKDTCLSFAPQLVAMLSGGVDPKTACSKLGLCETSDEPPHYTFTEEEFERLQAGPGCELCQFVVNTIDTYLKDNHTEAAINATITKLCNSLPEPLKDTCNGFAPQLIKILAQGFDPKQACTKIGLCASEQPEEVEEDAPLEREETPEVVEVPAEPEVELSAGPGCELCQFVVNTVDTYLKDNHTEAAINATITKFCNELPEPLKDTCNGFAPQLIAILAQGFDPKQACTKIGLCASQAEAERYMPHPEALREIQEAPLSEEHAEVPEEHEEIHEELTAGPGCELCEFVVNTIDTYLKDNHTEAAINATVTKLCNSLPEPLKDTCNGFAPQLIKILAQGFDPKQACTKIGLCATSDRVEHPVEPEEEQSEEHEEHQVLAGPGCELCEFVVNTVDTYLKDNHTEAAINATITKLCNSLPEPLKDTCNGFAPQLIKILAQGFDPKQACTKLGLCSGNTITREIQKMVTPECHLCELVMKSLDKFLKQNSTDAYVNTTILRVCLGLPEPLKSTCLKFAPELVEALSQGVDPNKTCERIKLCTANEAAVFEHLTCEVCESNLEKNFPKNFKKLCAMTCEERHPVPQAMEELVHEASAVLKEPKSAVTCELCMLLVKTLDTYLKNNHSEAAINSTIYKICATLPSALQLECHLMAPLLVKELANGFNATKACTAIHACDAERDVLQARIARSIQEGALQGNAECSVCKGLVGFIDKGIDGNEEKAKQQFDDICHRLPPPTDQTCLDFVDPNFPKIWNEIVNGKLSPENVCKTLKICT